PPPELLSGHTPNGGMSTRPHVAIVPLANVGWPHATGDLLGFAVVLPRGISGEGRERVLHSVADFARIEEGEGASAELHLSNSLVWKTEATGASSRASMAA